MLGALGGCGGGLGDGVQAGDGDGVQAGGGDGVRTGDGDGVHAGGSDGVHAGGGDGLRAGVFVAVVPEPDVGLAVTLTVGVAVAEPGAIGPDESAAAQDPPGVAVTVRPVGTVGASELVGSPNWRTPPAAVKLDAVGREPVPKVPVAP